MRESHVVLYRYRTVPVLVWLEASIPAPIPVRCLMVLKPANSPRRPDPSERPSFAFAILSPESTASQSKPPKSPLQKLAKLAREDPPPTVTIRGLQVQYNVVKRNVLAAVVRISKMRSFVKGAIDKADAVQESCEIMMDNNPSISDGGSLAEAAAKGALRELKMWAALAITAMTVQDKELVNLQDQLASAAAFLDQEEEVMQPPKKMLGPDDGGRSPSPGAKAGAQSQSPSGRASRMLRIAAAQVIAASPPRSPASCAGGHARTMDRNLRVAAIQKAFIEATALANETRIACAEAQKVAREHQSMIERQRSLLGKAGKMLVISKGREHGAGALEVNEDAEISNPTDEEPYSPSPSGLVEGLLGTNRPISEPRRPGFSPSTVVVGSTDKPTSEKSTVRSGRSERETVRSGRLHEPLRPGRLPAPPPVAVQDEDDEDAGSASKGVSGSYLQPLPMMDLDSVAAERAPAPTSAAIAGMEAPAEPPPASHVRDEEAEQAVEAEAQQENDESEGQSSPERAAQEQVEDDEGEEGEEGEEEDDKEGDEEVDEEGEEEGDTEDGEEGEEEGDAEDGEEGEGDAFDEGAARAAAQEMDVSELEAALAEFGVVPSGDKETLVEQLVEAQAATAADEEEEADEFDEEAARTAAQEMDVAELEAAIAEYGLEPAGDKDELVDQLVKAQGAAHVDGVEDGSDASEEPIGGLPG